MKVRLLPLAIGAAVAMPGVALADGPTLYGKMNVTYEAVDYDAYDEVQLNSNASRLGVKGKEEISDNLSVIYQAEFEIMVDDGAKSGNDSNGDEYNSVFSQRDIFVGLEGGWGMFKVGKYDTPLKAAQGKIDEFNDMQFGDIGNLVEGENRVSNSLQYSTPAFGDAFTFNVAFMPGEDGEPTATQLDGGDNGAADSYSVSAVYSKGMLYLAAAMDDNIAGADTARFVAGLYFDMFELGFLYNTSEEHDETVADPADEQEGYVLSAGVKLGESNKLRAQYGYSEYDNNLVGLTATTESTQYGIGFDHDFSKQSKVFVNYIALEEEIETVSVDKNTFQLGIEHKF